MRPAKTLPQWLFKTIVVALQDYSSGASLDSSIVGASLLLERARVWKSSSSCFAIIRSPEEVTANESLVN